MEYTKSSLENGNVMSDSSGAVPKTKMGDTNKSGSPLPSGSHSRTGRCPLLAMRSLSPFLRSPLPLSPSGSSPSGLPSPSPLCPLNNEISNPQTFEPIRSPKSPVVELVGEDLEVEEQEGSQGIGEEGEQEGTNEDEGEDTSRKRKTTSNFWEHFTRKIVNGKFKAQCHHCSKLYLDGSSQVRNNLARMVILHEYPLSIVDHIGFREFMKSLQPLFKLISRNTLQSDIIKIYDNEKEKALKMIDKNGSRMAITTDMWTSSNKKRGFMSFRSEVPLRIAWGRVWIASKCTQFRAFQMDQATMAHVSRSLLGSFSINERVRLRNDWAEVSHLYSFPLTSDQTLHASGHCHNIRIAVSSCASHITHVGSMGTFLRARQTWVGRMYDVARHIKFLTFGGMGSFHSLFQTRLSSRALECSPLNPYFNRRATW
ncbi:hypothetical protein SO802_008876 [Lithocarpus litseifolius]|uniref:BED-type domain-containing protein n=1 Tax=Lithocarpus litseifolius TaxID=425828 RepID=A0AAW2DCN9_9ROSI